VGGSTLAPIMTAYRQQVLLCAAAIELGVERPRDMKSQVPNAVLILLDNVYGWFERKEKGVYALTPAGQAALLRWPQTILSDFAP
ncbi:DUF2161 family putative PD-(D/E)XK-type phosphodiesterase, partial [Rhizobium johnstonii]|uniref:DUF2161 family putative PD-(D/E)XK-type phosphodiesterase n=1 Tax=Rhizobium johnstonii TaxID=3019933 RepID=UPI003F97E79D